MNWNKKQSDNSLKDEKTKKEEKTAAVDEEKQQEDSKDSSSVQTEEKGDEAQVKEEEKQTKEEKAPLTKEEELEQKLKEQAVELDDYKDKYLRLAAEFDNYRKRTLKEKAELILNGGEKSINSILPVLDDLERALVNMEKADDVKAIKEGVGLIHSKFVQVLKQNGVQEIETLGKELNTDFHEAIAVVPVQDEKQKGKIIDCTQKGYTLNEKVIRHAKVVIGQ